MGHTAVEPLSREQTRVHRQTCCSRSLEVVDSTLSYFPFRVTQPRCAARFPPVLARAAQQHVHVGAAAAAFSHNAGSFSFPPTKWTDQVPTECQTLTGLVWWPCKLTAIILCSGRHWNRHSNNVQSWSSYVPASQINDQYFVLCMSRTITLVGCRSSIMAFCDHSAWLPELQNCIVEDAAWWTWGKQNKWTLLLWENLVQFTPNTAFKYNIPFSFAI